MRNAGLVPVLLFGRRHGAGDFALLAPQVSIELVDPRLRQPLQATRIDHRVDAAAEVVRRVELTLRIAECNPGAFGGNQKLPRIGVIIFSALQFLVDSIEFRVSLLEGLIRARVHSRLIHSVVALISAHGRRERRYQNQP